ncbi:MAG: beta-ketoacyl-[acyl-carrier-protein] synthase II [Nitrospirae bacterium RBG_16_64_22]|nr:MAG: beta-ketoacyl-[acyl-carrier-protein] synthase II [Nitrospirae bacterium RBG_16_64_22]
MDQSAKRRRVAVTGLGLVTPLGLGVEKSWSALVRGESGVRRITRFDPTLFNCQIAAEVKDFDPAGFIDAKEIKKMDTFIHYALAASQMAVDDARLAFGAGEADRVGVHVGAGIGGLQAIEKYHEVYRTRGPGRISPFFIPMVIINLVSGQISIRFGAKGPNSCAVTACSTGTHSIGDAARLIQHGEADVMIAGGTEATITPLAIGGFAAMKALSRRNDDPTHASRPFDRDRDGFVMGEGAGIVILEEWGRAVRREAKIYAEVIGYGATADAYHITAPPDDGEGAVRCMRRAIEDARIQADQVGYINAHATSTFADSIEIHAIKEVFGAHARKLAVGGTKSMTGHLLGAAGGIEAIFSVLAIDRGILPPTINQEHPDPACDLDTIPNTARQAKIDCALSNSFGFGGTNACLIFRRPDLA